VQVETLGRFDPEVRARPTTPEDRLGGRGVVDPVHQETIIDVHRDDLADGQPRPRGPTGRGAQVDDLAELRALKTL